MTTVETRVVNPVRKHAPVDATQASVDAALTREEDRMIEDEEINSCEGEDVEDHMFNVAIMKSVVDAGASKASRSSSGPESPRYGLRKRQRPGEPVLSPGKRPKQTATIMNGRLSLLPAIAVPGSSVSGGGGVEGHVASTTHGVKTGIPGNTSRQRLVQPIAPNITNKNASSSTQPLPHPGAKVPTRPTVSSMKKPANRQGSKMKGSKATSSRSAVGANFVPTSGTVPNPLSQSTPPPQASSHTSYQQSGAPSTLKNRGASPVPCPLPASVPCPLPDQPASEPASSERRVTIADPPVLTTRNRIFSVDLDPSTFDFPDMSGDQKGDDDIIDITTANIPDDLAPFKRDRAYSFEFFNFAGDDLLPAPPATPAPDAPLPDPASEVLSSSSARPRGDSIIFDPSSFQDGGIHEENAIIKVKAAVTKDRKAPAPSLLADSRLAAPTTVQARLQQPKPQPPRPVAVASHPGAVPPAQAVGYQTSTSIIGADNGQVATLPSALSVMDANGNSTGTFQMDLLNKGGRIGIYLPADRRARIARFHAKRKMRIWRKRIKYDCRKKLADSRPRIKGRFVKRSDMDE